MKIFTNQKIWKRIVIALVFIILFQFSFSTPVQADFGGKLLDPILSLVTALGDGIVYILHYSIMGQDETLLEIDFTEDDSSFLTFLMGIANFCKAGIYYFWEAFTYSPDTGVDNEKLKMDEYAKDEYPEDTLYLPLYSISAEEIFKGNILLFDTDFFNPKEIKSKTETKTVEGEDIEITTYYYINDNNEEVVTSKQNTSGEISGVISKWYIALRNIAIVLMMSILLYIGIRMLISSISSDKAKYKQMLVDWLVGMCLLFLMHYIMAFSVTLTNQFIKVVNTINKDNQGILFEDDDDKRVSKVCEEFGMKPNKDGKYLWQTNLLGRIRIAAEMNEGKVGNIGFVICFIILVFYTVFFAFTYLKRLIYLAFLTMIAPFVAMTYPIDKANDGQAQGFNKWLKEYIFNLLIQPMHLLLYTILVGSVFDFAFGNIWYMIVAIGFLIPGEKLLRNLFGFEKASTPASLAGAAVGAGLLSRGLGGLLHKVRSGPDRRIGRGSQDGNNESRNENEEKSPRMDLKDEDFDETSAILGGAGLIAASKGNSNSLNSNKDNTNKQNAELEKSKQEQLNKNGQLFNPTNQYNTGYNPSKGIQLGEKLKPGQQNKDRRTARVNMPNRKTRLKNAAKVMGRRTLKSAGRKLTQSAPKLGRKAIRTMSGATLGAMAGTIGLAAGIASGDASNALSFGVSGLAAGAMAGSAIGNTAANITAGTYDGIKNSDVIRAGKQEYLGEEEFNRREIEKQIKERKKDLAKREQLERKIGMEATKEMYDNGEIDTYFRNDINDVEDIALLYKNGVHDNEEIRKYVQNDIKDVKDMVATHKIQEEGIAQNRDQAIAVQKYSRRTGDTTKMKNKDKTEWKQTFTEEFKNAGHTEENAKIAGDKTFDMIDQYNKMRTKI